MYSYTQLWKNIVYYVLQNFLGNFVKKKIIIVKKKNSIISLVLQTKIM